MTPHEAMKLLLWFAAGIPAAHILGGLIGLFVQWMVN